MHILLFIITACIERERDVFWKTKRASREIHSSTPRTGRFLQVAVRPAAPECPCCVRSPLLRTLCPKQLVQTNTPVRLSGTRILSVCVSQKTSHKSNKYGHQSNLQPEGAESRAASAVLNMGTRSPLLSLCTNHKRRRIARMKSENVELGDHFVKRRHPNI